MRTAQTASSILAVALLASSGAAAFTEPLKLTFTTTVQGLPPGARAWIEVAPEYHEFAHPATGEAEMRDLRPVATAEPVSKQVWRFQGGVSNELAAQPARQFLFPGAVVDHGETALPVVRMIYLKTRFGIESLEGSLKAAAGENQEVIGMLVPPGATEMSQCLRLSVDGDRLGVETAADCSDAAYASTHDERDQSAMQIRLLAGVTAAAPAGCGLPNAELVQPGATVNGGTVNGCPFNVHGCGGCTCFTCFLYRSICLDGPCTCDYSNCISWDRCN